MKISKKYLLIALLGSISLNSLANNSAENKTKIQLYGGFNLGQASTIDIPQRTSSAAGATVYVGKTSFGSGGSYGLNFGADFTLNQKHVLSAGLAYMAFSKDGSDTKFSWNNAITPTITGDVVNTSMNVSNIGLQLAYAYKFTEMFRFGARLGIGTMKMKTSVVVQASYKGQNLKVPVDDAEKSVGYNSLGLFGEAVLAEHHVISLGVDSIGFKVQVEDVKYSSNVATFMDNQEKASKDVGYTNVYLGYRYLFDLK